MDKEFFLKAATDFVPIAKKHEEFSQKCCAHKAFQAGLKYAMLAQAYKQAAELAQRCFDNFETNPPTKFSVKFIKACYTENEWRIFDVLKRAWKE